jgi:arylsulfatase A-like enzyme/Tfp pilus assembly protein PilF
LLVLSLVLASAIGGCGRERQHALNPGAFRGAPIILISIDTLRADRLPLYGYGTGSTPALDRLGREAVVLDDLYSHSPLTLPSHASLLTGLLPFHHGVRDNVGYAVRSDEQTLATRLKAAGYATGGAVSAYVLRHQTGIGRGFDFFDDRIEKAGTGEVLSETQRDGAQTVDALAGWIDQPRSTSVFAFLHLYEPHTPYAPPSSHRMADPYDGEVAYADDLVGRLFDRLRARGLFDPAIVAVVSDHGEGLGDHGEAEHGIFLYREALHVPGILRLPGGADGGTRVPGTIGTVDVTATLLDLVGLGVSGLDGRSLVPALTATRVEDRSVYSETLYPRLHFGWSDLTSVTDGRYRFIRAPRPELFDLTTDPREQQNLVAAKASTATALGAWLDRTTAGSSVSEPAAVTADARERLKALGYVGSAPAPSTAASRFLPDPKDGITSYEALKQANALEAAGKYTDAIAALRRLVQANPRMLDGWESLAKALARADRIPEAIDAFGKVLAIEPLKAETHLALAKIYGITRETARARQHAELALSREPAAAYEALAELAMDERKPLDARVYAHKSIDADSSRYMSYFLLGVIAQEQGRCDDAIGEFERAIDRKRLEPQTVVPNLHARLGDCFGRTGRPTEAEREFNTEIATIPASPEARIGLASLYRSQGRDAEARHMLEGVVEKAPQPMADTYWTVVRTFTVLGDVAAAREWAAKARQKFPSDPRFR